MSPIGTFEPCSHDLLALRAYYRCPSIRRRFNPALEAWGQPLNGRVHGWADLMWLESMAMFSTMLNLKREDEVPSLSVHDSLIVAASKADIASQRLARMFLGVTLVRPLLKIKKNSTVVEPLGKEPRSQEGEEKARRCY